VAKTVVMKVIMDSGEQFTLPYDPAEIIEKFTHKDGRIRDEFIEMGAIYINPKHVSMMCYDEVGTEKPNIAIKWKDGTVFDNK